MKNMKKILLKHTRFVFSRIYKMLMNRSTKLRERSYQAAVALATAPYAITTLKEMTKLSKKLNKAADLERKHNNFVAKIDNLIIRINGSAGNDNIDGEC